MSNRRPKAGAGKMMAAQRGSEKRRSAALVGAAVAVLVVFAGAIGFGLYQAQREPASAAVPPGATEQGIPVGSPDAPVTLDSYIDFQCPACAAFEQRTGDTIGQLVDSGKVRVIYHPVAYLDRFSSTGYSSRSSAAAGCAAASDVFPEFEEQLFTVQPPEGGDGLPTERLIEIGRAAGSGDDFAECVRQGRYEGWSQRLTDAASRAGINATPTVLVNGEQLQDVSPAGLRAAVDAAAPR
ncbi:MAG: thioredoxin domain-containing protein [Pseudonocardiaceae bacterium]|nr:thioredoxin domain-containing protein [Pseudonocardiaceae bacterium]